MTQARIAAMLALGLTALHMAMAQEPNMTLAEGGPATSPTRPVVATVVGDPVNRVGDPIFVTVTLRNASVTAQIIKNFVVRVDGSASGRFDNNGDCALSGIGELTLSPGEIYSQTCRFPALNASSRGGALREPATSESGWLRQHWYQDLFSADLRLLIDVDVEGSGSRRFFPVISIKANESSVFIGGMVGAMLLALFVLVERLLKNPDVRENWVKNLMVTVLMGLRGGLLAVIALLLGKTTQGVGSPVSLTVVDFAGGILIGLFSYPLASWISSTLKVDGVYVPAKDLGKGDTNPMAQPAPKSNGD